MSQNAKDPISQAKINLIMSFGAHMMTEDTEPKMDAFSDKKLLTLEESRTPNASMEMNTKLLELEPIALALRPTMNAI
jgi:hypothetical protein